MEKYTTLDGRVLKSDPKKIRVVKLDPKKLNLPEGIELSDKVLEICVQLTQDIFTSAYRIDIFGPIIQTRRLYYGFSPWEKTELVKARIEANSKFEKVVEDFSEGRYGASLISPRFVRIKY